MTFGSSFCKNGHCTYFDVFSGETRGSRTTLIVNMFVSQSVVSCPLWQHQRLQVLVYPYPGWYKKYYPHNLYVQVYEIRNSYSVGCAWINPQQWCAQRGVSSLSHFCQSFGRIKWAPLLVIRGKWVIPPHPTLPIKLYLVKLKNLPPGA